MNFLIQELSECLALQLQIFFFFFLNCFTKSQDVSVVNIHLCWLSLSFGNRSGIKAPALWFWGKPLRNSPRHKRVKRGHWKYCLTIYRWHGLSCLQACTAICRHISVWAAETGALQYLLRTDCFREKKKKKKKEIVTGEHSEKHSAFTQQWWLLLTCLKHSYMSSA